MNTNRAIEYVVSQTRENISFLLSAQQISPSDAMDILDKLPKVSAAPNPELDRTFPAPYTDSRNPVPPTKTPVNILAARPVPPIPSPFLFRAKALWAYNEDGREPNDLTFAAGDIIEVTDEKNSDWWTGRLNGKGGVFPSSYVQKLPRDPPPAHPFPTGGGSQYPEKPHAHPPQNFPSGPPPPQNFNNGPSYYSSNPYPPPQNNYYTPPPQQGNSTPIYQTAPPPAAPVTTVQEPEKKQGFFKGGLGNTLAHSAAGGVGFGAGSAVGSGIINSIF
ncbi:Myosin IC heavy chain [Psilocybe cubensis]|uniref:Myosin IC heavy chain n=2 Tax=Psilocybe cubensis TaxID=181762 RepID=A0ACB8H159_PSICU|nr:Myosin IC heavy chain [Psilocybe cubensis]KAH9481728.1 Myosin IC heavy chain [Psilocybe cubensis]